MREMLWDHLTRGRVSSPACWRESESPGSYFLIWRARLPKPRDKIRVLLADDHHMVRAGIRQLLEGAGDLQVVAEAGDGEEARALIQKHHPDVAVLDIQM